MEDYKKGVSSDISWVNGFSQDSFYGLENSFLYSENINTDDELHGIKLSQKAEEYNNQNLSNCQLVSVGDHVYAIPMNGGTVHKFNKNNWKNPTSTNIKFKSSGTYHKQGYSFQFVNGVVFQDYVRAGLASDLSDQEGDEYGAFLAWNVATEESKVYIPYDHTSFDDIDIASPLDGKRGGPMGMGITQILNMNNSRLIVGCDNELRVYYPELDITNPRSPYYKSDATPDELMRLRGKTGWKRVQTFEAGVTITGLTATFEYLKVWTTDEGYNTKIFYYQANNDFRSTFVYNQIDLTGVKVIRAYNVNGTDYFTASLDGTDGYITLNKIIGTTVVQIFKRRGGLCPEDISPKENSAYFIGPTSINVGYLDNSFYLADKHGVFKFKYDPSGIDTGYLKWRTNFTQNGSLTPGLAICENYLYISDQDGLKRMRLYDSGVDGYQDKGILISREFEGSISKMGNVGCYTKILDQIRCHYEISPQYGQGSSIKVYISPNNTWTDIHPSGDGSDGWYLAMEIDGTMRNTRLQISNFINKYGSFMQDRQTINYCIEIKRGTNSKSSPIVRELQLRYHIKGKTNELYELQ